MYILSPNQSTIQKKQQPWVISHHPIIHPHPHSHYPTIPPSHQSHQSHHIPSCPNFIRPDRVLAFESDFYSHVIQEDWTKVSIPMIPGDFFLGRWKTNKKKKVLVWMMETNKDEDMVILLYKYISFKVYFAVSWYYHCHDDIWKDLFDNNGVSTWVDLVGNSEYST